MLAFTTALALSKKAEAEALIDEETLFEIPFKAEDINEGQVRLLKVGNQQVHISKYEGQLFAHAQLSYGEALPLTNSPDGTIHIKVPKEWLKRVMTCRRDPENKTRFVILGGGASGQSAALTLRQNGFTGEIVIVTKQPSTYNWTLESKSFYSSDKGLWLTGDGKQYWKEELDVEINSNRGCYKVLPEEKNLII